MITFKVIGGNDFIYYYKYIQEMKSTNLSPEVCLGRCLTGQYHGLAGFEDDECCGIVIYYVTGDVCRVVYLHAINAVKKFRDDFYELLKERRVKSVQAESTHNEKAYERLMGMKKLYTVYGRTL